MARCSTYDQGECTQGACLAAPWVQEHWGNATDWPSNAARGGFQLTMLPTYGAIVAYAAGDGYSVFGHVGLVVQVFSPQSFLVREMNFAAWDQYDERVSNLHDVEAFILPPGVAPGQLGPTPGGQGGPGSPDQVRNAWSGLQNWLNAGADHEIQRMLQVAGFAQHLAP